MLEQETLLLNAMPDGIVIIDLSCTIRLWNNTMARMTGLGSEHAVGRALFGDDVLESATDALSEDVRRVFGNRKPSYLAEEAIAFPHGAGACRVAVAPYGRDNQPPPHRLCLLRFQNLTDRVSSRDSRRQLRRHSLHDSELGIILIGMSDNETRAARLLYANGAFGIISGLDATDVVGQHPDAVFSKALDGDDATLWLRCALHKEECVAEIPWLHLDGRHLCLKMRLSPICDSKGAVRHVVGFLRDVTIRKRSETALGNALHRLRKVNAELDAKRKFLKAVLNNLDAMVVVIDADDKFTRVNSAFAAFVGADDDKLLVGEPVRRLVPMLADHLKSNLTNVSARTEIATPNAVGDRRLIDWHVVAPHDLDDEGGYVICTGTDVTERRRAEILNGGERDILELLARDASVQTIANSLCALADRLLPESASSLLSCEKDSAVVEVLAAPGLSADYVQSAKGADIGAVTGLSPHAMTAGTLVHVTDLEEQVRWGPLIEFVQREGVTSCWVEPVIAVNGAVLGIFVCYHSHQRAPDGATTAIFERLTGIAAFALEQSEARKKIRDLALYDPLTQLPNRTLLLDRLSVSLIAAQRHGTALALLFLDLDGFKNVNDVYGHGVGDEVLVEVGRRLSSLIRASDTATRFGGDEFVVILTDVEQRSAVETLARKLVDVFETPIMLGDGRLVIAIGVSIGIALFPEHADDSESLLAVADDAMYEAKTAGKGRWRFARPSQIRWR